MNASKQLTSVSVPATKQLSFVQHFKQCKSSPNPEQIGVKRESVTVTLPGYSPAEVIELATSKSTEVAEIINSAIIQRAKRLFLDNTYDWNFIPSEADCSVDAIYAALVAENSRGSRTITKESLKQAATYYVDAATEILGKSEKVAQNGATLIESKFAGILGNPAAINAMTQNLIALVDSEQFNLDYAEIFAALLEILTSATQAEIDADAL